MFLNYSTCKNHLLGKVKNSDINIMLYGHVDERYQERLKPLQKATKSDELKYESLLEKAVNIINDNYEECINPDAKKVRHVIRDEIHLECEDGKHYIVDITMLVTGTMIKFDKIHPRVVEPQYKELVDNDVLRLNDKILSIETLASTIRFVDEKLENFSLQPTVAYFNTSKCVYKVKKKDILNITKHMIKDKDTKISKNVMKMINQYNNDLNVKNSSTLSNSIYDILKYKKCNL